jgi:hypothetical protein
MYLYTRPLIPRCQSGSIYVLLYLLTFPASKLNFYISYQPGATLEAVMKLLSALVAVSTIGPVYANWRMECLGRTGLARLDLIVSPGGFSSHAYAVHGSLGKLNHPAPTAILSLLPIVYS